ncbi:MAG: glycosyltransferase family 2 protein [Oscillospiraceae bacterium]
MNDLISVIMPVYKVEDYLAESIESVLNQDYSNLELILIDDGSPDRSGEICDAYAAKDSRVRVIHQKNGGAAAAKNAGLRVASGMYLSFVDSDDYLEPNVFGHMLKVLQDNHADAAQFSFQDIYRTHKEPQVLEPCVLNEKEYLIRFTKDWSCALLWNKLYKRSLFDGVFFEEGHKIDDEYFTYRGFMEPCTVVFDDTVVYNYRKRTSSVMSSPAAGEQRILDCIDSVSRRRETVLARWPELKRVFDENYLDVIWYLSGNVDSTEKTIEDLKKRLRAYFSQLGNSLPPRYLWKPLWQLYRTDTSVLLERCRARKQEYSTDAYFA